MGRPADHHFYEDERDLIRLAAIVWHAVSVSHGFKDGNKRAGLLSAFAFLAANGTEPDPSVSTEEPGTFTDACFQQNRFTVEVLDRYLRTRCRWIQND